MFQGPIRSHCLLLTHMYQVWVTQDCSLLEGPNRQFGDLELRVSNLFTGKKYHNNMYETAMMDRHCPVSSPLKETYVVSNSCGNPLSWKAPLTRKKNHNNQPGLLLESSGCRFARPVFFHRPRHFLSVVSRRQSDYLDDSAVALPHLLPARCSSMTPELLSVMGT